MGFRHRSGPGVGTAAAVLVAMFFVCIAAWVTHIIVCLSTGLWGFLIAGALFFPIGIVHGIGYWLGFFHG